MEYTHGVSPRYTLLPHPGFSLGIVWPYKHLKSNQSGLTLPEPHPAPFQCLKSTPRSLPLCCFFIFKILFIFLLVFCVLRVLLARMTVHHMCGWCQQRPEEGVGYHGTRVSDGLWAAMEVLGLEPGPLKEQPVSLKTQPSSQLLLVWLTYQEPHLKENWPCPKVCLFSLPHLGAGTHKALPTLSGCWVASSSAGFIQASTAAANSQVRWSCCILKTSFSL